MRNYTLITGATGLLGAYLLRDYLATGEPCAVLVRSNRFESARQRVESILARWERESGRVLPRPVVLEGSLKEDLGLSNDAIQWVARHCRRIVHNAASLTFERVPETNEPYRSNVDGARFAVDFALKCGIPQFHHVSTAYVCGLRSGVCREDELDVGQKWGNDYEIAKATAEKIVREASFPEPPTFYRPAIITGDSITGYTSTYHGFYTPLKVAASFQESNDASISSGELLHFLGMEGFEHKNFVPVEWIAQAIVKLSQNSRNVGKTFHLTPRQRVTVGEMYEVFVDALVDYGRRHKDEPRKKRKQAKPEMLETVLASFRDQMRVYRSYWRDDPTFDQSNVEEAIPDLLCPTMSRDVLFRLSRFALEANFGWPKPQPVVPDLFIKDALSVKPTFTANESREGALRIALDVRGAGGCETTFELRDGAIVGCEEGLDAQATARLTTNVQTASAIRAGLIAPEKALASGAIFWETSIPTVPEGKDALEFLNLALEAPNRA